MDILRPRKKLRITLPKYRPAKESPPRVCVLCDVLQPARCFPDNNHVSGHDGVCNECRYPGHHVRGTFGNYWEALPQDRFDIGWMDDAHCIATLLGKAR